MYRTSRPRLTGLRRRCRRRCRCRRPHPHGNRAATTGALAQLPQEQRQFSVAPRRGGPHREIPHRRPSAPNPHNEKRAFTETFVSGEDPLPVFAVREGGVEPPRPFGHWNLNPARLPIPPPAHWVCPPAPALFGPAPSDIQKISTPVGVDSHPFPVGRRHPGAPPRAPRRARGDRAPRTAESRWPHGRAERRGRWRARRNEESRRDVPRRAPTEDTAHAARTPRTHPPPKGADSGHPRTPPAPRRRDPSHPADHGPVRPADRDPAHVFLRVAPPARPSARPAAPPPAPAPRPLCRPRPPCPVGNTDAPVRKSVHVSTSYRSRASPQEQGRVHSQVRDTGPRPPLRSLAGCTTPCAPVRHGGQAHGEAEKWPRRSSKGSFAGNFGGVDTRRRGRQGEPADFPARGYDQ